MVESATAHWAFCGASLSGSPVVIVSRLCRRSPGDIDVSITLRWSFSVVRVTDGGSFLGPGASRWLVPGMVQRAGVGGEPSHARCGLFSLRTLELREHVGTSIAMPGLAVMCKRAWLPGCGSSAAVVMNEGGCGSALCDTVVRAGLLWRSGFVFAIGVPPGRWRVLSSAPSGARA